jgi:hypothetical protein
VPILLNRVKSAEYVRNIFSATPEIGTKYDDVLDPRYWTHVAPTLHPTDRIEVLAEDGAWFAELIVLSCGKNWAKVFPLRFVEMSESQPEEAPGAEYVVVWRGMVHKHSVVRTADKVVVKAGFASAAEAKTWLATYEADIK